MPGRVLVGISVGWIPLAFLFDGLTVLGLPVRLGDAAGPGTIGLVSFAGLAAGVAVQPIAGRLSDRLRDRFDRRAFLALASLPALAGLWVMAGTTGLAAAVGGYVLAQLGAGAIQAAQQTLIPEHAPADSRGRAAGLRSAFDVGGALLAFLAIGLLLGGNLVPVAIATSAVVVVAVGLAFALVPRTGQGEVRPAGGEPRPRAPLPDGLASLVAARFLFLLGTYAVGRFLLLLVAERLGLDPAAVVDEAGGLLAAFTLATALAAIPLGLLADRVARTRLMVAGAAISAAGCLVLVPAAGLAGVAAGGLAMSIGTAAFITANWAALTDIVPATESGRLMGIASIGTGFAAAAAGLVGWPIELAGFGPALVLAAVAMAASPIALRPWAARRAAAIPEGAVAR